MDRKRAEINGFVVMMIRSFTRLCINFFLLLFKKKKESENRTCTK